MREKIESLVFYGTGDEAYELFCATCHYCHELDGAGLSKEAETVYKWAKRMAAQSKKDLKSEWSPYTEADAVKGIWG